MLEANKLTSENVREVFLDSLYRDEEVADLLPGQRPEGCIEAEGIVRKYGLHPERLEAHRMRVVEFLRQLPPQFREGYSFLAMCVDIEGRQWGEQANCEELCVLAIALNLGGYPFPREYWMALPGSVPYFHIAKAVFADTD